MEKTITVKGTGSVSVQPDLTIVSLTLKSLDKDYEKAMQYASEKLSALQSALENIGFAKDDLKTTSFNVNTEYESVRDKNGNYKSVFEGYACVQGLKLEFDFDTKVLSKVLSAIAACISEPQLNIRFSVKDKAAVNDALLESAAANAKKKAEVLTKASGVTLGELISINYNWAELDIYSDTRYEMEEKCMCAPSSINMDIPPDDIEVGDSATFVWSIA